MNLKLMSKGMDLDCEHRERDLNMANMVDMEDKQHMDTYHGQTEGI